MGILLVVGCSFEHGTLGQVDATGSTDGRASDAPHAGDAPNGTCTSAGQRVCADATHSAQCSASLSPVTDRTCPPGSACSAGYCQPPTGATSCEQENDCSSGKVCDLYVSGNSLVGYCTNPTLTNNGSSSCSTPGYDSMCDTGICAEDSNNNQRCLYPCVNGMSSTCPNSDWYCHLVADPTKIEGVSTTGQYACLGSD